MNGNFSFDYFYVDRGYYFKQVKSYLENLRMYTSFFRDFMNVLNRNSSSL